MKIVTDVDLIERDIFFWAVLVALSCRATGVRCCIMLSVACSIEQPLIRAIIIAPALMKLEETLMSARISRFARSTDVRAPWSFQGF